MNSTREQVVLGLQLGLLDPRTDGVAGYRCDLELHWPLRLLLHDDGTCCHLVTVADVADLQPDEIASA